MRRYVRLGINIDHVATLRNARGENYPEVIEAAKIVEKSGADLVTVHLREDRRHINENDLGDILNVINIPVNLEIAANPEMVKLRLNISLNVFVLSQKNDKKLLLKVVWM